MKLTLKQKIRIGLYAIRSLATKPLFMKYNPDDLAFLDNPYPVFSEMRDQHRMFWSPRTMAWHVSLDHAGTIELLRNDKLTLSFRSWMFAPESHPASDLDRLLDGLLMSLPAKDHNRVRRLVSPAFSPRYVDKAKPVIETLVNELLDRYDNNGIVDVCGFCNAVPAEALAIYIGIPADRRRDFAGLGHAIMASFDAGSQPDVASAERGIALIKTLMAEKRLQPDDTFLSTLVNSMEGTDRISEDEALALIGSLMAAGVDTTLDYMTHTIYALARNAGWAAWLAAHPERVQDVLDESTRWNNFGHRGFFRFATEDMTLCGQKIRKGEIVQIMAMPANWDQSIFDKPEEFNPARANLDKLFIFGIGAHYCLGHAIAKLIGQVTTLALVQRYPQLAIESGPVRERNPISRRMKSFFVRGSRA